jgi:excisionase family DNA binding protein
VAFDEEFLAIEEAARRYGRSRDTLDRLAKAGLLRKHRSPGDKRVYLKIAELERVLRPKPDDGQGDA